MEKRKFWQKVLALSKSGLVGRLWDEAGLEKPEFKYIRKPETGLCMVRGKMDGDGSRFNLGEVTISRCAVKLKDKYLGVSYLMGTRKEDALFFALIDAMLQDESSRDEIFEKIIMPAHENIESIKNENAEKIDKTKVEFFTMG